MLKGKNINKTQSDSKIMRPHNIIDSQAGSPFSTDARDAKDNKPSTTHPLTAVSYLTPQKQEPLLDICRLKYTKQCLVSKKWYHLNSRLLDLYDLPPFARERMIAWFMQQASKRHLQRETCAIAISLMDLYFMKGETVNITTIQELGIACLRLACKFNESFVLPIESNPQVFSQSSICNFEMKILKITEFRINPPNYAQIANNLIEQWTKYSDQNPQLKHLFTTEQDISANNTMAVRAGKFFELLDCCIGCHSMLDYHLRDLVYNAFIVFSQGIYQPQKFKQVQSAVQAALQQIWAHSQHQQRSASQTNEVIFDSPIQKLIEVVLKAQRKAQLNKPVRSELARRQVQQIFSLTEMQWSCFQSWQPYLLKVLKQCNPATLRLQQVFQV